jgi:glycosyltransferase involved in cell wall biosynthesis
MKKVLLVADQKGWVFDRHCHEIKKRIKKYDIDIAYRRSGIRKLSSGYDLVYVLDPIPLRGGYSPKEKTIMGLRCEFLHREHPEGATGLYNDGFKGRCVSIRDKCCIFHVVNRRLKKEFEGVVTDKPLLLARHGIDTSVFDISKNKNAYSELNGPIVLSVSGRGSSNKGFGLVKKACEISGAKIAQAEYRRKLSLEEMPGFYSKAHVHVCMSKDEGLNNPLMEAGAMGLAPISTDSGAASEMISNGESGLIIDRSVESLVEAINKLKDDELRVSMAKKYHKEIVSNWSWGTLYKEYESMFDLFFSDFAKGE